MNWYKIDAEIPDIDFVKQININGKKLCLVRDQEILYVIQNTCPHAGGILSEGWCKNGHIICPIHRWEYNLETGRGAEGQGDYIDKYPIDQRSDGVYVGFKEGWITRLFNKH